METFRRLANIGDVDPFVYMAEHIAKFRTVECTSDELAYEILRHSISGLSLTKLYIAIGFMMQHSLAMAERTSSEEVRGFIEQSIEYGRPEILMYNYRTLNDYLMLLGALLLIETKLVRETLYYIAVHTVTQIEFNYADQDGPELLSYCVNIAIVLSGFATRPHINGVDLQFIGRIIARALYLAQCELRSI